MNQIPNIEETNTREVEEIFEEYEWLSEAGNSTMHIGGERLQNLKNDIKAHIHHQLQKAHTEKFIDGIIAATQWLIDNGHLKAGKELNEMMFKALIQRSELDQKNNPNQP